MKLLTILLNGFGDFEELVLRVFLDLFDNDLDLDLVLELGFLLCSCLNEAERLRFTDLELELGLLVRNFLEEDDEFNRIRLPNSTKLDELELLLLIDLDRERLLDK